MIRVTYRYPYELTVEGHAQENAPSGVSLVCACTTALVGSLCEALAQNRNSFHSDDIKLSEGYCHISVSPYISFSEACEKMFEVVWFGLLHLQRTYPEYIQVNVPDVDT